MQVPPQVGKRELHATTPGLRDQPGGDQSKSVLARVVPVHTQAGGDIRHAARSFIDGHRDEEGPVDWGEARQCRPATTRATLKGSPFRSRSAMLARDQWVPREDPHVTHG